MEQDVAVENDKRLLVPQVFGVRYDLVENPAGVAVVAEQLHDSALLQSGPMHEVVAEVFVDVPDGVNVDGNEGVRVACPDCVQHQCARTVRFFVRDCEEDFNSHLLLERF
jgi:hypothetical protein